MARARRARDRLRERYEGGHALGVMEGGGTTLRFGGEGEAHIPPRAASVAGYKRQRDEALALKARQRTTRARAAQGPETPAQALARMLNIGETEAYHAVRNPYFGRFVQAKVARQGRLTELDRMQTGRMEVTKYRGKTAMDMLGQRLDFGREGLKVHKDIAAASVMAQNKRAIDMLGERVAKRKSVEKMAGEKAEALAGSAAGKAATRKGERAETARAKDVAAKDKVRQGKLQQNYDRLGKHRDKLVARAEKLEDTALTTEKPRDKAAAKAARKKVQDFDAKKELDAAHEALQGFQPMPTAAAEGEAAAAAPAAQPAPAPAAAPTAEGATPLQFQTSAEAIDAIKAGQLDLNAPGGEEAFLSLPPQVQEEVRAWLRKNGYLD